MSYPGGPRGQWIHGGRRCEFCSGTGRPALLTGAPINPAAIAGTSHPWPSEPALDGHDSASEKGFGSRRATPGLIAACLAAIGGGLLAQRHRALRRKPELLGTVELGKANKSVAKRKSRS